MSTFQLGIGVVLTVALSSAPLHAQKTQPIKVAVVRPQKGNLERLSVQRGTIQAYESVRLFAKVGGFLKSQNVDIGDRVRKGQVLAVVDVPELEGQVKFDQAGVQQVKARLQRARLSVNTAKADLDAAKGALLQAEAAARSAAAMTQRAFGGIE